MRSLLRKDFVRVENCKAPQVRETMFKWLINVRGVSKGRLPIKMFWSKCQQVYDEWLKQQPKSVPEQDQLNFSKHWIQDWMKEYNVSLRKSNKKYAIKKEDRIIRIKDYFENIWTGKKVFYDKYGVDHLLLTETKCLCTVKKAQVQKHFL